LAGVVLPQVKQIEEIEAHRHPATQLGRRVLDLQAPLRRKTRQRTPSSFGSNSQLFREKKGLVRECRKHRRRPGRRCALAEPGFDVRRQRLQQIPLCQRNRG
jgi:hypothetical protein